MLRISHALATRSGDILITRVNVLLNNMDAGLTEYRVIASFVFRVLI